MTPPVRPRDIAFRPLTPDDAGAMAGLLERTFGASFFTCKSFCRWEHFANPSGPSVLYGAWHEEELVGTNCLVPGTFLVDDRPHRVALSVSSVTHTDYQRLLFRTDAGFETIFTRLCRLCYEEAERQGIAATFAFPNEASYKGFVSLLGFEDLGELEIRVAPMRLGALMGVVKPSPPRVPHALLAGPQMVLWARRGLRLRPDRSFAVRTAEDLDGAWDRFAQSMARHYPIMQRRDAAFLRWRFQEHPQINYRLLETRQGDDLIGYLVYTIQPWPSRAERTVPAGYVVDYLAAPDGRGAAALRALLCHATRQMFEDGAALATVIHMPRPPFERVFRSAGYWLPPQRFRPRRFHCILRQHGQGLDFRDASNLHNWYFTLADDDII